jgi:phosphatidylserine/phosphatidylglycerophosphate/cardiolipin synthase-like enzyme
MPNPDARGGITLTAHTGQRGVLLAFDLDEGTRALRKDLAGFAIQGQEVNGAASPPFWLKNFLGFPKSNTWQDSDQAPFQIFHWTHFPQKSEATYRYTAWPVYFVPGKDPASPGGLVRRDVDSRTVEVSLKRRTHPSFELGFTRGFMSSQAYLNFVQAKGTTPDIRPKQRGKNYPLFDTTTFQDKYRWLGVHAGELINEFIGRWADPVITVDIFAYDLDEPDVIRAIGKLGARGRIIVDDSIATKKDKVTKKVTQSGHGLTGSAESRAAKLLLKEGLEVKRRHFKRFSHDKVFILKRGGKPEAVLTGSANFSLRGLYVQSNSVVVIDDPEVTGWYADAFEQAWTSPEKFSKAKIAKKWFTPTAGAANLPGLRISYAPHTNPAFSINDMATRIRKANGSALFSIMTPTGSGDALKVLTKDSVARKEFLLVGTTENSGGVKVFSAAETEDTDIVPFDYLRAGVPQPFRAELSGREGTGGQHIHHKFIVLDFNGQDPVVYCGSSNLAGGGEISNGDNLLEIRDPDVAAAYAVEAIALYDHYRFRSRERLRKQQRKPFVLDATSGWVADYYDTTKIKSLQRRVYAKKT